MLNEVNNAIMYEKTAEVHLEGAVDTNYSPAARHVFLGLAEYELQKAESQGHNTSFLRDKFHKAKKNLELLTQNSS